MSASEAEKKVEEEEEVVKGGELLFCGATCWDIIGRRKGAVDSNLVSPSRLRPLVGVDIRFVASGSGNFLPKISLIFVYFFSLYSIFSVRFVLIRVLELLYSFNYLLWHRAVSCHCVALDVEGRCYTWGRNEVCLWSCNIYFKLLFHALPY